MSVMMLPPVVLMSFSPSIRIVSMPLPPSMASRMGIIAVSASLPPPMGARPGVIVVRAVLSSAIALLLLPVVLLVTHLGLGGHAGERQTRKRHGNHAYFADFTEKSGHKDLLLRIENVIIIRRKECRRQERFRYSLLGDVTL